MSDKSHRRVNRLERGFWCFALCRSPNGWNINIGNWIFTFGEFEAECAAAKAANEALDS